MEEEGGRMSPRRYALTFAAVTCGVGYGLHRLGWLHWLLLYPLAAVGLVSAFGVGFMWFVESEEQQGCGRCGKKGRFKRRGLQQWPVCPECLAGDRQNGEQRTCRG